MKPLTPSALAVMIVLMSAVHAAPAAAPREVVITGIILSSTGEVILGAQVAVLAGDTRLTPIPQPVSLLGKFEVRLSDFSGSHVSCEFSAAGFITHRRTVVVNGANANAGTVQLARLKGLSLGSPSLTSTGGGKMHIMDVFVHNQSAMEVEIKRLELVGTARKRTKCIDYSPAISFTISDRMAIRRDSQDGGQASVLVEVPPSNWKEQVDARGSLEKLPCDQLRLQLSLNVALQIRSGAREKLRVAIPSVFKPGDQAAQAPPVNLQTWEQLLLRLKLSDGSSVEATVGSSSAP